MDSLTILTALLVLVTAYYAWQTKETVGEMRRARQSQFMPALKIEPTRISLDNLFAIKISNIGLGPAKNIKGKIKLGPAGNEVNIVYPILHSREKFILRQPFDYAKTYDDVKKFDTLELSANAEDLANTSYIVKDSFILKDMEKIKNDDYKRNELTDAIKSIDRTLDRIKNEIGRLKR